MRREVRQPAPLATVPVNDVLDRVTAILAHTPERFDR